MFKIVLGLFAAFAGFALGVMMGAGPHDSAANLCGWAPFPDRCLELLPNWFDKWGRIFPTALVCFGIILLFWAPAAVAVQAWLKRSRLIPLHEAASHIYGEIRGTDLGRFTEGLTDTPNQILDSIGNQILHNADVHVRHAPSPKWEKVPRSELNKMGVCQGATGIRYWGQDQAYYIDPKVSRRDMARVTKHLKQNANFVKEWSKPLPPEQSEKANKLEPDIDAGSAFNQILAESEWRQEQLTLTRDTSNLARNWLEIRLDTEIHKALVNARLKAWGEEILPNGAVAPERPIPADTWIKVEIMFGRVGIPRTSANWRVNLPYTGKTAWAGIKFSKKQFFELYPLTSPLRPLKIIFDSSNPGIKFWSIETAKDENGKATGTFWEYRTLIRNNSPKDAEKREGRR
jgi:hypothetical protein